MCCSQLGIYILKRRLGFTLLEIAGKSRAEFRTRVCVQFERDATHTGRRKKLYDDDGAKIRICNVLRFHVEDLTVLDEGTVHCVVARRVCTAALSRYNHTVTAAEALAFDTAFSDVLFLRTSSGGFSALTL